MKSEIRFLRNAQNHESRARGLGKALEKIDLPWLKPGSVIGIKLHWGEPGNNSFLPPDYASEIAHWLVEKKAKPFIFDTTTLYRGSRRTAIDSLYTAHRHGFDYARTGAPVIIADGFSGKDVVSVPTPSKAKHLKKVQVVSLINHIDGLVNLSHFKGHIASGFGGAIKNISMGMASRATKQVMHANVRPKIRKEKCVSCGVCVDNCPENAIAMVEKYPVIDYVKCIGCAECIAMCPYYAMQIQWDAEPDEFCEKLVETAGAITEKLDGKLLHINILANIVPECDCMPIKMKPLIDDLGLVIGTDIIAIDSASCDLVNSSPRVDSREKKTKKTLLDEIYPHIPWRRVLEYGEELGIGTKNYLLVDI